MKNKYLSICDEINYNHIIDSFAFNINNINEEKFKDFYNKNLSKINELIKKTNITLNNYFKIIPSSYSSEIVGSLLVKHIKNYGYLENKDGFTEINIWHKNILQKIKNHKPLQYILGNVNFYGQNYYCDNRALIPRPETEEMIELIIKNYYPQLFNNAKSFSLLDMGCGSGVIGLSLSLKENIKINEKIDYELCFVDKSIKALKLTKKNYNLHKSNIFSDNPLFIESDLFDDKKLNNKKFNIIVANLPYIEEKPEYLKSNELKHEPASALFAPNQGLEVIFSFIEQVKII